jgi:3-deoxy-manno-octulosonate cytidylyltransferase (CMP-KDO synthetase)
MKIIAVIPARYDSTRFPGKPLVDINGKSMIQHVYERVKESKFIDKVIVATDDKRIFEAVKSFEGKVVMTSNEHQSGTDRIREAIKDIKCDIVVNVQGDEPGINPKDIDKVIKPILKNKKINISTLAIRIENGWDLKDENKVKVVFDKDNFALYFSRNNIPFDRDHINNVKKENFYKHIGLYVYRRKFLLDLKKLKVSSLEKLEKLEQLRFLENGVKIKIVLTDKETISVDTPNDLKNFINSLQTNNP